MAATFSDILETIFARQKKDYITFTQLKKELPVSADSILLVNSKKTTNKELENYLKPHLPMGYCMYTKGNVRYLLKKPIPDIIKSYLKINPNLSLNQVRSRLPFKREELADIINDLIEKGRAKPIIIPRNDSFGIRIIIPEETKISTDALKKGFDAICQGKPYVKIYELRRHLSWPSTEFEKCLTSLWESGEIELQASDPSLLDKDQQNDSYRDKTNTLRILLFWRGK